MPPENENIEFTLSFVGRESDRHEIDFYDVAEALKGFQRSLAITTHLVLNGEVIVQAPSLKSAKIYAIPPREGSWEFVAIIIAAGVASKDSVLGHLLYSGYDYVLSKVLGFHVDYDKTLGQLYSEHRKNKALKVPYLDQSRFDSAVEKCTIAVKDMHRPIVKSETATQARISIHLNGHKRAISHAMNNETYQYIVSSTSEENSSNLIGQISSYNINTFKGRIYLEEYNRPVPFELLESAKSNSQIDLITDSLKLNAKSRSRNGGRIKVVCYKNFTRAGVLKNVLILSVYSATSEEDDMEDLF